MVGLQPPYTNDQIASLRLGGVLWGAERDARTVARAARWASERRTTTVAGISVFMMVLLCWG